MRAALRVTWMDVPWEIREPVTEALRRWGFLIPAAIETLGVEYWQGQTDNDGKAVNASAAMNAQSEYRQAFLSIYGGWLMDSEDERQRSILHEILHIPIAPMADGHKDAIERLLHDAPVFQGYAIEQWRVATEGAVQDLRNALWDLKTTPRIELINEDGGAPDARPASAGGNRSD